MIIRREFFKKVIIGSIFALQLTATGPVYNALAVEPDTDKTSSEDSIPSNVEVDKETKVVEKVVSEKENIDREVEKAKRDEEFRKAENIKEAEEAKKKADRKKAREATEAKLAQIAEIAKKAKEEREKVYDELIKKYYDEIDDKDKEIRSNEKKFRKINLYLTYDNITKEEKQALQEELNTITELNKKLINDESEILKKLNKVIEEKYEINRKAERNKEFRKAENMREAEESKKEADRKKAREATEAKLAEIAEIAKKAKEEREKVYNDLIKKYYDEIDDKDKEIRGNEKKLEKINLDLTYDNITKEEKQALQKELNTIAELNKKLIDDISEILKKLNKVVGEKNEINRKAEKAERDEEFRKAVEFSKAVEAKRTEDHKKATEATEYKKAEEARKAEEAIKAEEARKAEEAIKGYKIEKDINGKEWKLYSYKNDHDLTVKILTDEDFISNWSLIANKLGFGWCGGTNSPRVGEDFSIKKTGDNEYTLSANYNPTDPYAHGYAADKRLKIKVSNIRFFIDGNTLKYGEKEILSVNPITVAAETFRNEDDKKPLTGEFGFEYSKTTSITREDRFDFSQEIGTETKFTVGIPKIAANETTVSVKVGFGQGWSDTKENSTTKTYTKKITVEIAPKHRQRIELVATEQQAEVKYKANIYVSYDISLEGFLRWGGNAHVDHPKNRPHVTVNFSDNSKGKNAIDFIKDIYTNRHIPGYSQWDFHWVDQQNQEYPITNNINALSQYKVGGVIEGVFRAVDGTEGELIARDQIPLSTPITKEEVNSQDSVVFKARELQKV